MQSGDGRRSQAQQDAYVAGLKAQGWTFRDGVANAIMFDRGCEKLTLAAFPSAKPEANGESGPDMRSFVFVFLIEPTKICEL